MAGSGATAVRMLTMTLSMKKIVDQEIAVQVKGYPLPQPFSLGGKTGFVVTSSNDKRIHKGWRVLSINGVRFDNANMSNLLANLHRPPLSNYEVKFFIGDEAPPAPADEAELERVRVEELELAKQKEKEKEKAELEIERMLLEELELAEMAKQKSIAQIEAAKQLAREAERDRENFELELAAKLEEKRRQSALQAELVAKAELEAKAKAKAKEKRETSRKKAELEREQKTRLLAARAEKKLVEQQQQQPQQQQQQQEQYKLLQKEELLMKTPKVMREIKVVEKQTGLPPRAQCAEPQRAMLAALTKPKPKKIKDVGPCDKCDGDHGTDHCPHYKNKKRDKHKDAWDKYGKKGGGSDSNAAESISPAERILCNPSVVKQPGDGSCLFHSMSFGIQNSNHSQLRATIAGFILNNPSCEIGGTPIKDWVLWDCGLGVKDYSDSMKAGNKWGGAIEIAVCAKVTGRNVLVYESAMGGKCTCISKFEGGKGSSSLSLRLLYGGRCHYDAIN
ncbi:hypothetical protein ScalyP_jg11518 [Parmales sp. scaly parma]|nr:hypothetical protein ScalyP_jg11518 [Parmales sp. scaly parma]